jgi:hypothetical protein
MSLNMASPTGDARNGNHQLLYDQVQISLARRPKAHTIINPYGIVPKILCSTHTFWLRHSRKHERAGALKQQGSMQLEEVGC